MRAMVLLLVALLLAPFDARAGVCDAGAVTSVLDRWMNGQHDRDRGTLEQTMTGNAVLVATSMAGTVSRNRADFIAEKVREPAIESEIYAYLPMRLDCGANKTTARVERRGCAVVREGDGVVTELAQTEVFDLADVDGKVLIRRAVSMLDAMRHAGKVVFAWNDFVDLPACASALRN